MSKPLRDRLMNRWWSVWPGKPAGLQNAVGRLVCLFTGHEKGRSHYCDYCGKDLG